MDNMMPPRDPDDEDEDEDEEEQEQDEEEDADEPPVVREPVLRRIPARGWVSSATCGSRPSRKRCGSTGATCTSRGITPNIWRCN
jgi:hypothetical protein